MRFTKGVARYTGTYDKPTSALPQVQAPLIQRPTRRWGGITGRSLVTASDDALPKTGVLSLAEMLQAKYSQTAPASFTFVGASYERSTTNTATKTFVAPTGTQGGDVLVAFSCVDSDTYIDGWTTNNLGAAQNEFGGSSELDGWQVQGVTSVSGGTAFQDAQCLARVLPSNWDPTTTTDTDTWTIKWNNAKRSAGVIVAFRPSAPITGWEKTASDLDHGTSDLSNSITAVSSGLVDVAVGPRLYLYLLSGKPHATYIENPDPTFPAGQGWQHTDGDGVGSDDQMDFAYKLSEEGDAFVSTTITATDTGQQIAHLYCFTMTT